MYLCQSACAQPRQETSKTLAYIKQNTGICYQTNDNEELLTIVLMKPEYA